VTKPMDHDTLLTQQNIWIPKGDWIERATGKHFTGPRSVDRSISIDQSPVYVKAGAIVPMQPQMRFTGEKPVDPLIVTVYPLAEGQTSSYTLYEDASDSEAYKHGVCAWTRIRAKQSEDGLTVDVDPVQGAYPGMLEQRAYEIRLPGDWPPDSVTVNGTPVGPVKKAGQPGWRFEGNTLTTVITAPSASVHRPQHIIIHRPAGSLAARQQLDGFAGSITRLRGTYDTINAILAFATPPDSLIDALQTGDRMHYKPETARAELARFPGIYAKAVADVQALVNQTTVPEDELEKHVAALRTHETGTVSERAQRYKLYLKRASKLLEDGKPQ
ncbi:MAG TPA: DUF5110 domain-containing protein, partial [Silvibacterium sp.]|nr:DUF5110 domain-containing protein [Silvibacterium sp.]